VGVAGTLPSRAENNGVAKTPAMGWSSWSFIRHNPTAADIDAQADALKSSGLSTHGFVYVNVDDFWMACNSNGPEVDGNGRWVADTTNSPIAGTSYHAKDIAKTLGLREELQLQAHVWHRLHADSTGIGNGNNDGISSDQRRSALTLWSMASAPLLLATHVTHLDATDKAMLTNDSVLGVDQDGVAAKRIVDSGNDEVFSKKVSSGAVVIALFNTGTSSSATMSVSLLGLFPGHAGISSGKATITDLWAQKSAGTVSGTYSATLRPGETRLIRAVAA
jgi:hypothetical protein